MKKRILSVLLVLSLLFSSVVCGLSSEAKTLTKSITFSFNGKKATVCKVKVTNKSVSLKGKVLSEKTYKKFYEGEEMQTWGMGQYVYDYPIIKNNSQIALTLLEYYKGTMSPKNYVIFEYEGFEICGIKRGMSEKKAYKKLKNIFGKNNIKKVKVKKTDSILNSKMSHYKNTKYKYVIDGTKGTNRFVFTVYVGKGKVTAIEFEAGDYSKLIEV